MLRPLHPSQLVQTHTQVLRQHTQIARYRRSARVQEWPKCDKHSAAAASSFHAEILYLKLALLPVQTAATADDVGSEPNARFAPNTSHVPDHKVQDGLLEGQRALEEVREASRTQRLFEAKRFLIF